MFRFTCYLPCCAFLCSDGVDPLEGAGEGRWNRCLHADLDRLEGAETNIGEKLGGSRGSQVETGLVFFGVLFSHKLGIEVLEVFISSVFETTLNGVTGECGTPASKYSSHTLSPADLSPGFKITLVEIRIDLTSTLDEIERSNSCMCCALGGR